MPPPKLPKPLHDAASFLIPLAVPRGGTERDDLARDGRQNEEGGEGEKTMRKKNRPCKSGV
jgi:hypothetical protein